MTAYVYAKIFSFMSIAQLIGLLIIFALVGVSLALFYRYKLWKKGQAKVENMLSLKLLFSIPKRYFVDLHHIVMRDAYIAWTHIMVAGGTVLALLFLVLIYVLGFKFNFLSAILLFSLAMVLFGACFVLWRRINRPKRLSAGKWNIVPWALFAFAGGLLVAVLGNLKIIEPIAYQIQLFSLIFVTAGLAELSLAGVFNRPFKHILIGSLNLAFHPRQDRFSKADTISAALKPVNFESEQPGKEPGTRSIKDFAWNQLLNFDACIECGKCQQACPAFVAEQPLNPKKLIQDLVASMEGRASIGYAGSSTPGLKDLPAGTKYSTDQSIVGSTINNDTIWSCTSCRACVYECPMMIEHVDAIVDLRRNLTMVQGELPQKSFEALENLRHVGNPAGNNPAQRANWGIDLKIPVLGENGINSTDILLFSGQGAYELRNQNTIRNLAQLLNKAQVNFAILGNKEIDCGDLARRLGDEALFQEIARRNINMLSSYKFNSILTADPHIYNILKNEYPDFSGNYKVYHHTEYLLQLFNQEKLTISNKISHEKITFHDPCYLGRYNGLTKAPRELLKLVCDDFVEMKLSAMRSRCCGWGGGAAYSDIPGKRRIPDIRMKDVQETKAEKVAVACPNCMTMLEGVVEPHPQVTDIVELVTQAVK